MMGAMGRETEFWTSHMGTEIVEFEGLATWFACNPKPYNVVDSEPYNIYRV